MSTEIAEQKEGFSEDQRSYLDGFFAGLRNRPIAFGDVMPNPVLDEDSRSSKRDRAPRTSREEKIKAELAPLDAYPLLRNDARTNREPDADNVFRYKWHGLFWLAPAHQAYMCRLRIPGGTLASTQWRELASIADDLGSGFGQLTTRNNVQLRLIEPKDVPELLRRITAIGLHTRGAGADNLRNFTASPTAGICPYELIDVLPFVRDLAATVLATTCYCNLPRKFNVAFDGGNLVGVAEDTNDIGFEAVRIRSQFPERCPAEGKVEPSKVYFRVLLGGVTGHQEFAADSGVLCPPEDAVDLALAVIKVFHDAGDRTNRKKARLVYLIRQWGIERFLQETETVLGKTLLRVRDIADLIEPSARPSGVPHPHLGAFPQKQEGFSYLGVHVPVGLIETDRMRALADVAEKFGSGELRLTVFQSVIIPNISDDQLDAAKQALRAAGLDWSASLIRGGLAACTGNRWCKYSSADTKGHALALTEYLDARIELDQPLNIHVTGCPHSCAQHYIGDIGLLACKVEREGASVEGFHVFIGGGFRESRKLGRQLFRGVATGSELHERILALLELYLEERKPGESFQAFAVRQDVELLAASVESRIREKAA